MLTVDNPSERTHTQKVNKKFGYPFRLGGRRKHFAEKSLVRTLRDPGKMQLF